jgi:hypothetical protein
MRDRAFATVPPDLPHFQKLKNADTVLQGIDSRHAELGESK